MAVDREAQLVRKFVEFSKLLNVYLNHFPATNATPSRIASETPPMTSTT